MSLSSSESVGTVGGVWQSVISVITRCVLLNLDILTFFPLFLAASTLSEYVGDWVSGLTHSKSLVSGEVVGM
jgi:hypothetical protein